MWHEVLPVLAGLLVVIMLMAWPFRKIGSRFPKEHLLNKFRKLHKWIGLVTIVVVLAHCPVTGTVFNGLVGGNNQSAESEVQVEREDDDEHEHEREREHGRERENERERNHENDNEDKDVIVAYAIPVCLLLLAFTWVFRKMLKGRWIVIHRVLAVSVLVLVIIHVVFEA